MANTYTNGNLRGKQDPEWLKTHERLKDKAPDELSKEDFAALGHGQPVAKAIRQNCIDCQGGSPGSVRECQQTWCPLWPFRMGSNPFNRRELSEEQRARLRASMARVRNR